MATVFEELLDDLGKRIKIPLDLDSNDACRMIIDNKFSVQIELNRHTGFVIICCELGEIPPGRYREDLFKSALIENGKDFPRFGDFAYSDKINELILQESMPLDSLDGEFLFNSFLVILDKARSWNEAISTGQTPNNNQSSELPGPGGMFGLRP